MDRRHLPPGDTSVEALALGSEAVKIRVLRRLLIPIITLTAARIGGPLGGSRWASLDRRAWFFSQVILPLFFRTMPVRSSLDFFIIRAAVLQMFPPQMSAPDLFFLFKSCFSLVLLKGRFRPSAIFSVCSGIMTGPAACVFPWLGRGRQRIPAPFFPRLRRVACFFSAVFAASTTESGFFEGRTVCLGAPALFAFSPSTCS